MNDLLWYFSLVVQVKWRVRLGNSFANINFTQLWILRWVCSFFFFPFNQSWFHPRWNIPTKMSAILFDVMSICHECLCGKFNGHSFHLINVQNLCDPFSWTVCQHHSRILFFARNIHRNLCRSSEFNMNTGHTYMTISGSQK